ncbi:MAG: RagB/SusD family nutrient uptake outer membrane protein [Gracilimonas sp.]|uniref:RagB/SusD family nutrient uptake outer membrane protein n=1 Tax=Gracilimonas sp. TaxID=1974203 RepID=UPI0019B1BC38|nr:RagB/SusD family nutrient uptake outer membrane protein [Gracilimonas sp.]MBD3616816.1 RagB/SusD family nutrient uptake outer membrane protein [Gracilimonas sp.]
MNNLKIIQSILIVTIAVFASSCDSFLNEQPLDQRVESNFYETREDAQEALVAIYDVLQWNTIVGFHVPEMLSDIASDDAYAGGASRNDAPNIIEIDKHNIRTTNGEVHGLWQKYYTGIYRANKYIKEVETLEIEDSFKNRTIAEAKFLRAYYYFDLVRFFRNVPLITEPLDNPDQYNQPQALPSEVFSQIAQDLTAAIPALPGIIPANESGRVSKWAAQALLGRVYLYYTGVFGEDLPAGNQTVDRAMAIQMVDSVINHSGHSLLPNYEDNFKPDFEFSNESVFEISYSDSKPWWDWGFIQGGEGNMAPQMQGPRVDQPADEDYQRGWSFSTVTQELIDEFDPADPRLDATVLFESELNFGLTVGFQHTGKFTQKYTTHKSYTPSDGQLELNWGNNYRVIRFSDVLLMGAELYLNDNNAGQAKDYLDLVRQRAGMPEVAATMENIRKERRIELALEGHRYWDLQRYGQNEAEQHITITGSVKQGYQGDASDFGVTYNTARLGLFPIPQSEIDISNGELQPNPGY